MQALNIMTTVRENVCNNSKKRKKSRFLDFEKNVKNVKKRTYSLYVRFLTFFWRFFQNPKKVSQAA